jgi:hypothetical protein
MQKVGGKDQGVIPHPLKLVYDGLNKRRPSYHILDLVHGLGLAPSIGPTRIGIFTRRWKQSQLPKPSGLVLEY